MKPETTHGLVGKAVNIFAWLRQNIDLVMLAGLALLALTGWAAVELADEVEEGATQRYDVWVLRQLRTPGGMTNPIGPPWLRSAARDITALGSASVLTLVTLIGAGYLLMQKRYRMLAPLIVATVGGTVISLLLKSLFARPRPEFAVAGTYVTTASFPSGHSMLSAVVYLTLGVLLARTSTQFRFKLYFITVAVVVTILVGFTRIYLGVHYPTDVLAGWCFGLIWALMCWLVAYFLQKRGAIEQPRATE